MKKVFAVSVVGAACVFAANAGAEEGKSGFYLTGKAGASVVSLSDQRFLSGDEEETSKYKGGDDHDTVFSGGIAAGYDFYPQFSIPVRTELEFYARGNADTKYNLYKDDWSRGDLKNEVSVNTLMLNAYYDFRNDSAFTPWVSAGIGYARIHQKTTGISTGITGTDTVVVNRCHVQALLTTSHGALARVFAMTSPRISLWTSAIAILMRVTAV